MKVQNMTIDINRLNTDELEQLALMFYHMGQMKECQQVNDRILYIKGWLSADGAKEYYDKFIL